MIVTLMSEDKLYDVLLPEKIRGCYWIEDPDLEITDKRKKIVSIEGEKDVWKITANKKVKLFAPDTNKEVSQLLLEVEKIYPIEFSFGKKGYIFTESYTQDRCTMKKYIIDSNSTINIGKQQDNQIVINSPYVSPIHAQISLSNGTWSLIDNNSKNGIYVNRRRVLHSTTLHFGDVLYILGVKIVFGNQFLALNNPDQMVSINSSILKQYQMEAEQEYEVPEEIEEKIYYRSPKFNRVIVPLALKIDAPSAQEKGNDTPLALVIAPSLVMGVASFSSGIFTISTSLHNNGNILSAVPTFIMSLSMLTGMVLFPFIMKKRDRRKKKEREIERRKKYLKYLENIRAEIYKESKKQQEILQENYPFVLLQMMQNDFYDMLLWNRVIGHQGFLAVRVGVGNIPLCAELSFPEQRFSIDDDVMREEVNRFSEEKQIVSGVPVVYSLIEHRVSGIVGDRESVNGILNNLLVQIAAYHSYDEVKLIFLCDESNLEKYSYVKWMPHIWDNDFRMRFLITNPEEVREMSAYFLREIQRYKEYAISAPYYIVVSTSKALSDSCAFLAELLKDNSLQYFSYLAAYDVLGNLPKECTMILQMNHTQGMMFNYKMSGGAPVNFVQDVVTQEEARKAVMEIAEYKLDLQGGKYALPDMLTFLDMYKVGKYEHLNVISRWKTSNPVSSLQAPIGVNTDGGLFYLDLHEEAHGPHGLIAGMTGSGKSEFIITYVLSLAVNYSPEDVAFILIDYKGGGLVGAFESEQYHLPHLAGTITNLDGAAITRSLLSIQSELKRRQRIFADARRIANEGTMDIYKYQKLYRSNVVSEPVPHLLIISDEFAELKSQQPEFMTQLISTARIGRSLGVHLILATQKPSGVVSDQIWANSKFKICLKVQDRADSMEMLKRPDAAELVDTGRFYLQVGYNELFEQGQSAWCGAPYLPSDIAVEELDERVQMLDHQGNVVEEAKLQKKAVDAGNAKKQIVEIVEYLTQIAQEESFHAKPLWLPEIPARIRVEYLEDKYRYWQNRKDNYTLNPIIGELDDPFEQDQRLLIMPLTERGNVVCYGSAGSGKEEFLTTILYSLFRAHTSAELNAYILDFGSETLQMFERAPQTGGVVFSGEDEKINNLFQMLGREVKRRKKQFVAAGGDYISYRKQGNMDIPAVVVIINEYANFAEQYEALDDRMASLTRDCTKYGIYFIVTNLSQSGIRFKLQQNFAQVYILQMNDKSEYTAILGNTSGVYPSRIQGRGIYREKLVYEFQTACAAVVPEESADIIKKFCQKLAESDQKQAKAIPSMPKAVYRKHFNVGNVTFENIPIGLNATTAEPVCINCRKGSVEQILALDRQDTIAFAEGLANMLMQSLNCETFVLDPDKTLSLEVKDLDHYITENIEASVIKLFEITRDRHNAYKKYNGNLPETVDMHPVSVVLMGLGRLRRSLSDDGKDKLTVLLEKTSGKFGLFYWVFDDYHSSNSYSVENWCNGDGIWIGNGIGDQIRMKYSKKNAAFSKNIDFTSGFYIKKAIAQLVKLLVSERKGKEVEEEDE